MDHTENAQRAITHLSDVEQLELHLQELYAAPNDLRDRTRRIGETHHMQNLNLKLAEVRAALATAAQLCRIADLLEQSGDTCADEAARAVMRREYLGGSMRPRAQLGEL